LTPIAFPIRVASLMPATIRICNAGPWRQHNRMLRQVKLSDEVSGHLLMFLPFQGILMA
jgi:hypothetical protein